MTNTLSKDANCNFFSFVCVILLSQFRVYYRHLMNLYINILIYLLLIYLRFRLGSTSNLQQEVSLLVALQGRNTCFIDLQR